MRLQSSYSPDNQTSCSKAVCFSEVLLLRFNHNLVVLVTLICVSPVAFAGSFQARLVAAAIERTGHEIRYDGSYITIDYPNGDVPALSLRTCSLHSK